MPTVTRAKQTIGRAKTILVFGRGSSQKAVVTAVDVVSAFNNAHDGTNGGMRVVLDTIAEGLKAEVVERYVGDAFDRHVAPNSWEQKVDVIRQFIAQCGPYLSSSIKASQPERYAHDFSELIRSYVEGLQQTAKDSDVAAFARRKRSSHQFLHSPKSTRHHG